MQTLLHCCHSLKRSAPGRTIATVALLATIAMTVKYIMAEEQTHLKRHQIASDSVSDRVLILKCFLNADEAQQRALYPLVGALRMSEAAGILARDIDYRSTTVVTSLSPISGFPAATALVSVGKPSIEPLLTLMEKKLSDEEIEITTWVLYLIDQELAPKRLAYRLTRAESRKQASLEAENIKRSILFLNRIQRQRLRVSPMARWYYKDRR